MQLKRAMPRTDTVLPVLPHALIVPMWMAVVVVVMLLLLMVLMSVLLVGGGGLDTRWYSIVWLL